MQRYENQMDSDEALEGAPMKPSPSWARLVTQCHAVGPRRGTGLGEFRQQQAFLAVTSVQTEGTNSISTPNTHAAPHAIDTEASPIHDFWTSWTRWDATTMVAQHPIYAAHAIQNSRGHGTDTPHSILPRCCCSLAPNRSAQNATFH
jgi:hypothetical protein